MNGQPHVAGCPPILQLDFPMLQDRWASCESCTGSAVHAIKNVYFYVPYCLELWPRGPRPIFEGGAIIKNTKMLNVNSYFGKR